MPRTWCLVKSSGNIASCQKRLKAQFTLPRRAPRIYPSKLAALTASYAVLLRTAAPLEGWSSERSLEGRENSGDFFKTQSQATCALKSSSSCKWSFTPTTTCTVNSQALTEQPLARKPHKNTCMKCCASSRHSKPQLFFEKVTLNLLMLITGLLPLGFQLSLQRDFILTL